MNPEHLESIATTNLVTIETRSGDRVIATVIWVAVDGEDIYVRSVRGEAGKWYQRAKAEPEVMLGVGDDRYGFKAIPAADPESIEAASEALRRKYRGKSLEMMLLPETLGTTLRLQPID